MLNILVSLDGISYSLFEQRYRKNPYAGKLFTANPSVTFPVHMSVLTGVWTETHGIFDNVMVTNYPYQRTELYCIDDETAMKLVGEKTLIHDLQKNDIECRLIHWPLGNGFPCKSICEKTVTHDALDSVELAKNNDACAMAELEKAAEQSSEYKNCFVAVHFVEYDAAAHIYGTEHVRTQEALNRMFHYMDRIKMMHSNTIFFSDHGLINRTDTFYPHTYTAPNSRHTGNFRFLCDGSGSIMYYSILKEAEDKKIIKHLLQSQKIKSVRWLNEKENRSDKPKAIVNLRKGVCGEDILPGESPSYVDMKGIHGYDPQYVDEMNGFIYLCGDNIKKIRDKQVSVVDLAPAIANGYGHSYACNGINYKLIGETI